MSAPQKILPQETPEEKCGVEDRPVAQIAAKEKSGGSSLS
jgi:hypothetical protein